MDALDVLKTNLSHLISTNPSESDQYASEIGVDANTLMSDPLSFMAKLPAFLEKFELSVPRLLAPDFQPVTLAKFKKTNNEPVSFALLDNLRSLAIVMHEHDSLKGTARPECQDEYRTLKFKQLVERVYTDLNMHDINERLSVMNEPWKQQTWIIKDLLDRLYENYGFRVFIIEDAKKPFNFDGVYFDKPVATAFVAGNGSYASKAIFSIFHELYHFFKDEGIGEEAFDIFDLDQEMNGKIEDRMANNFAANLLLYGANEDIVQLKHTMNVHLLQAMMKKYCISKEGIGLYSKTILSSLKCPPVRGSLPFAGKLIADALQNHEDEALLSRRRKDELLSAIGR